MSYARGTSVQVDATATEIHRLVSRYGARRFAHMTDEDAQRAVIAFEMEGRQFKFSLPLPKITDEDIRLTPNTRKTRAISTMRTAYEQACRQRWRALLLVIKAKLEAVEIGITTIEEEFLAHTVTDTGETVWQRVGSQLAAGSAPTLAIEAPRSTRST